MTDRWKDFGGPDFNRDIPPSGISYWQIGCNDAKAGKPFDKSLDHARGYEQGYYWGQHGRAIPNAEEVNFRQRDTDLEPVFFTEDPDHGEPDAPTLKNPYMEAIEAVEHVMKNVTDFHKKYPDQFAPGQRDEFVTNLLKIRDDLHEMQREDQFGE